MKMLKDFVGKCCSWGHNKNIGVLILRLALGVFFIAHSTAKFQNMGVMTAFFGQLGLAPFWPYIVATAEMVSGLALVLGVFLWLAAFLITVVMTVAVVMVMGPNPANQPFILHFISGWGPNVIYAAAALCLAFCGPGRFSLNAWWMRRRGMAHKAPMPEQPQM
jgi:putative oxidoreductase